VPDVSALELHSPLITTASSGLDRLRVIDRRRLPNARRSRRRMAHPFRAALVYTAAPALLLILYVSLWTAAVHGGYQEQRFRHDIQRLRIENQSLEADLLRLQSPNRIFQRATALGMQEPQQFEPVYLPASPKS
jgi:hypothetical protein